LRHAGPPAAVHKHSVNGKGKKMNTAKVAALHYIKWVSRINRWIGKAAMFGIFVMMAVLLFAAVSRSVFDRPHIWVMEIAQFTMAAYYLLGGGLSMQDGAHVRMDVMYDRWSPKTKAIVDAFTAIALIFYLIIMVSGGLSSTAYALEYGQKNYTSWGPPLAPIKIIMTTGMFLMLLQAIAMLLQDLLYLFDRKEKVPA
jgi:TRAP-type mannitol/chloroaromatic compound transport system permease small subunit